MTLERITRHILDQARQQATEQVEAARKETDDRLAKARQEEEARLAEEIAEFEAGLERKRRQETAKRRTEHRAQLLRLKTDIVEAVFAEAFAKILKSDAYRTWLRDQLSRAGQTSAQIVCRIEDRDLLAKLVDELGLKDLTFAQDGRPPRGGFLLRTEQYDLDVTLEAALADLREQLIPELVGRLSEGSGVGEAG